MCHQRPGVKFQVCTELREADEFHGEVVRDGHQADMMTATIYGKVDCHLVLKLNVQCKFAGNGGVNESLKQVKLQRN